MQRQKKKNTQLENDIESVALGTLLTGMRKLYWDTERFMRSQIEVVEARYQQLVGAAKVAARHEVEDVPQPRKQRGRPRKHAVAVMADTNGYGWSNDPEERRQEMARRMSVRDFNRRARKSGKLPAVVRLDRPKKKAGPTHPYDASHPDHAKWLKKVKRAATKRWESMSPAQRKARLAAMNA